jgi:hypothetical protein
VETENMRIQSAILRTEDKEQTFDERLKRMWDKKALDAVLGSQKGSGCDSAILWRYVHGRKPTKRSDHHIQIQSKELLGAILRRPQNIRIATGIGEKRSKESDDACGWMGRELCSDLQVKNDLSIHPSRDM